MARVLVIRYRVDVRIARCVEIYCCILRVGEFIVNSINIFLVTVYISHCQKCYSEKTNLTE